MKKYLTLYGLSWQKQLEMRTDFVFECTRSVAILVSVYYLWNTLLENQTNLFGYDRVQLLTYVLVMTLLRALVLACVTDRIPTEIAKGKLSEMLLRPISNIAYWATQDAASKTLNLTFAIGAVAVFSVLTASPFFLPKNGLTWLWFGLSVLGAMVIYFQLSYLLGTFGFWTSDSWGPRFCFEVLLEFSAGAYFPIDILPARVQTVLVQLPFPYLVYFPTSIYLERLSSAGIASCLAHQFAWVVVLGFCVRWFWGAGLRRYAAEGG